MNDITSASLEAYKAGLQTGWDDIEDIPDFIQDLPAGSYKGTVQVADFSELEAKDGKDAVGIARFNVLITEVAEVTNPEEMDKATAAVAGLVQFSFMGEGGKSRIKKSLWPIIEGLGAANIDSLWEQLADKEIVFTTKQTRSKPDADGHTKLYTNLVIAMLAE